jgi:5-methyltetrahydropteroyltriglutamate--homocysteine methyltransferase
VQRSNERILTTHAGSAFIRLVGQENVIAGSECGFAPFADGARVDPDIAFATLSSLAEGARIAAEAA